MARAATIRIVSALIDFSGILNVCGFGGLGSLRTQYRNSEKAGDSAATQTRISSGRSLLRSEPGFDDRLSSALAVGNLDFGGRSQCAPPGYSRGFRSSRPSVCLEPLSSISLEAQSLPRNAFIFAASRRLRQVKFAVWTGRVSERKILLQEA
jgi:hypothetical protein